MILNDIWPLFNRLIQSTIGTDIDLKQEAINAAQPYLVKRMIELGKSPDEFLVEPVSFSNTIDTNKLALPDNFNSIHRIWTRSGSAYNALGKEGIVSYSDLIDYVGQNYFDTSNTGGISYMSVKKPYLFTDKHIHNSFEESETVTTGAISMTVVEQTDDTTLEVDDTTGVTAGNILSGSTSGTLATVVSVDSTTVLTITVTGGTKEIKAAYYKNPADILVYDTLAVTSAGALVVGETVFGDSSGAIAEIIAKDITAGTGTIDIVISSGEFVSGETITGQTSTLTAVAGAITLKPATMEFGDEYRFILSEACALMYFHLKGSNEVEARSAVVDNLIEMFNVNNWQESTTQWGT
jgi:hypothetical protein